jgi:hypothetical protein
MAASETATMPAHATATVFPTEDGAPHPLGATVLPDGVNFSLYSGGATGVDFT